MSDWTAPRSTIGIALLLLGIDGALFLVAYRNGDLHLGAAPVLDIWDLIKALAAGTLLFEAALRFHSKGLAVFGAVFVIVGLVDSAAIHARLATALTPSIQFGAPYIRQGIAELLVLVTLGSVIGIALISVRDNWPGYRRTSRALSGYIISLLVFAVGLDFIDELYGHGIWALVEESGEAAVLSLSVAYVAARRGWVS